MSSCDPQYWQRKRSRRKRLNRVKAGCVAGRTYGRSAMTDGNRLVRLGLRISSSYSALISTASRNAASMAVFQGNRPQVSYQRGVDRTRGVSGKAGAGRVDPGGGSRMKK